MIKSLYIELKDNKKITLNNIDEFACGFKYFFVRHVDGKIVTYERSAIKEVSRIYSDGVPRKVYLKKSYKAHT